MTGHFGDENHGIGSIPLDEELGAVVIHGCESRQELDIRVVVRSSGAGKQI
jgi:hypothetical protein